jgi:hypothetical protein
MTNRFDNLRKIKSVHTPVFVAGGTADRVIPFAQSEELFAAANEPKYFLRLEGAEHNAFLGDIFYTSLRDFLAAPTRN